jgi:hypothetical protein
MRALFALFAAFSCCVVLPTQTPAVSAGGETMRIRSSTVTPSGSAFNITVVMENDNQNATLPTTFRRWWHFQVANLNPAGVTINFTIDSTSGYTDVILPVWSRSTDGVNWTDYVRCPTTATPTVSATGGRHTFSLAVPAGTSAIRLAKYFPYTVARKNAWLASIQGRPQLRSTTLLGASVQGSIGAAAFPTTTTVRVRVTNSNSSLPATLRTLPVVGPNTAHLMALHLLQDGR